MKQFFTKRRVLIIIVIVLVLAVLVLLLLPGNKRKEQTFQGGKDTPYPYEWTEKKDGSIFLSLCKQVPDGCAWRYDPQQTGAVQVSREDGEGSAFRVKPVKAEDVLLRFVLADETFPEDFCCELLLTVEVRDGDKGYVTAVTGNRLSLRERSLRGGEDFGCPYRIGTDEEGRLTVSLADDSPEADWQLFQRNSGDFLRTAGRKRENGVLRLGFYGIDAGTSNLVLYSSERRLTLDLTLASDEGGAITVQSHEMAAHPEWENLKDGELAAFVVAGTVHTPEGAENVRYERRSVGKQMEAAAVSFRYLDVDWTVYVTTSPELENLVAAEFENDRIMTLVVNGHVMRACLREEAGTVTAWCTAGERWYVLIGSGEPDLAKLLETANSIIDETKE